MMKIIAAAISHQFSDDTAHMSAFKGISSDTACKAGSISILPPENASEEGRICRVSTEVISAEMAGIFSYPS